jgi:hypothetical protein
MKAALAITVLLLSTVITPAALAQDTARQTSAVGKTQKPAGSREPSNSFEALPLVLKVGQEVKVRDEAGQTTRGKVVSVSDTQLVVSRKRFLRSRVERIFARDLTRRIDIVDSAWNGAVVGGAVAVGLVATGIKFGCTASCDKAGSWFLGIATLVPIGVGAGGAIDSQINKTIYDSRSQRSRVGIAPWIERNRKGVVLQVRF